MNMYRNKVIIGDGPYEKEVDVEFKQPEWANGETRAFVGDTEFDGHYELWGFEYFPTTYMKCSDLSGNEYRKGGEIRYFRNRKQCYSETCREPLLAHNKIGKTLMELMGFNWDKFKVGTKVWYRELPCIVSYCIEDQGCVVLRREDGLDFPDEVWHEESSGCMGEGEDTVKVECISPSIWWYRK